MANETLVLTVWKTLVRPAIASAAYYRASYRKKGIQVSSWADDILNRVDFAEGPAEVDIVRIAVKELGFDGYTRRDAIYERVFSLGPVTLPRWAAPELRNSYDDQSNGEWLIAGMEPLAGSSSRPLLFRVERRGGWRWLDSGVGYADDWWHPENVFLFAVPRK